MELEFRGSLGDLARPYLTPGHTILDMPKQGWTWLVLGWRLYLCIHAHAGIQGVQKRVSDAMDLEVDVAMSHPTWPLGTEFGSTARTSVLAAEPTLQLPSPCFFF